MPKRLLAIALVTSLSTTGCFTMIGMNMDESAQASKPRTKRDPGFAHTGAVVGLATDVFLLGLAGYALVALNGLSDHY